MITDREHDDAIAANWALIRFRDLQADGQVSKHTNCEPCQETIAWLQSIIDRVPEKLR